MPSSLPFPPIVEVIHFIVYVDIEEQFTIQLSPKCLIDSQCFSENDPVQVEL